MNKDIIVQVQQQDKISLSSATLVLGLLCILNSFYVYINIDNRLLYTVFLICWCMWLIGVFNCTLIYFIRKEVVGYLNTNTLSKENLPVLDKMKDSLNTTDTIIKPTFFLFVSVLSGTILVLNNTLYVFDDSFLMLLFVLSCNLFEYLYISKYCTLEKQYIKQIFDELIEFIKYR